jgi:hypothetical protein
MTVARYQHTATLLANGMVLIAGGDQWELGSAELYDPGSGTFTISGRMTVAREGHTATLLGNGMVLITGGGNRAGNLESAELYDPVAGTFTTTESMFSPTNQHTATLLPSGKVLLAGGLDDLLMVLGLAELYDPAVGAFTTSGIMTVAREGHTATLLENEMVLIAGGSSVDEPRHTFLRLFVEVVDCERVAWLLSHHEGDALKVDSRAPQGVARLPPSFLDDGHTPRVLEGGQPLPKRAFENRGDGHFIVLHRPAELFTHGETLRAAVLNDRASAENDRMDIAVMPASRQSDGVPHAY